MKTITLGRSGLEVSRIAFGTWQLGGEWGGFDEQIAIAAIRRARELGVNLFDTAQAYGFGISERLLGRALRDELTRHRDEIVIATKGGLRPAGSGVVRDASPEWLRQGVDASLTALGLDHIDLYQVHWPDPKVPAAETAGALGELVAEGKIGHVGVSNYTAAQMAEFADTLPVETLQPPYHLFRRTIEASTLPYTRAHDIGVLVYGPLAHGLLTGTLTEGTTFAADDWRAHSPVFSADTYRANLDVAREASDTIAERMRALHATPDGRSDTVAATTTLPAFPAGEQSTADVARAVTARLYAAAATLRAVHDDVDAEDPSSADLLHAILEDLEKLAWMLSAEVRTA